MPVDRMRINGPDETIPYRLYSTAIRESVQHKRDKILKKDKREDYRDSLEHRKIFIKTGIVCQAKGSAYIELDKTKVIVSVFDPREIPNRSDYSLKGEIYCEFKYAPFACIKRRLHIQDAQEKQYSAIMKQALESTVCRHEFPNFQVDIYALVLQDDGSCLSAAITAAGLALSEAGVPMYDLITSVTVGVQKDIVLLDPTSKEQSFCEAPLSDKDDIPNADHGIVVISILHTHNQVSQFYQSGHISLEKLSFVISSMEKACADLIPLVQKCIVKHVVKALEKSSKTE